MPRVWDQAYEIVEAMRVSRTETEVLAGVRRGGQILGYENFFIGGLPEQPGEHLEAHTLLSGWPVEWQERYAERGYIYNDPCIRRVRRDVDPFMWDDAAYDPDDREAAYVMNEAPDFGLVQGMTVPIHGIHGFHAAACFSASTRDQWSGQRMAALQLIGIFAHSRISAIIDERGGSRRVAPRLSRREIEVIKWSSAGKSAWDISAILCLSESTVQEYLANAQRKLNASNRTHAVAEAIRHRLIQ